MKTAEIEFLISQHYQYLSRNDFQGWDVFDGLNSRFIQSSPLYKNRTFRLAWIQFLKRSPINIRPLVGVAKEGNPKAYALFISGLLNMLKLNHDSSCLRTAMMLYEKLMELKSRGYSGLSWGYNFPWQARTCFVPAFKPNMVVSVFVGQTLLDMYVFSRDQRYLLQAVEICQFIFSDLLLFEDNKTACFGYIPGEKDIVHNVNLLAAGFLSRLFVYTNDNLYQEKAQKAVRFSVLAQRDDGAWVYGNSKHHQWVDNFHSGYNLTAIYHYQQHCGDEQFEDSLCRGLAYHLKHHFTADFLPRYSDKALYPLDIHCFSQAMLTLITLRGYIKDADSRLRFLLHHVVNMMYDPHGHFFYYQKRKFYTIKTPYIRWSQAWMFYTLTSVIRSMRNGEINLD